MNNSQMKSRCPSSRFISRAYLVDYKFFYDGYSKNRKEAVANIVGSSGDIVWGGLFQINQDDLLALDLYEGYPIYYQRKNIAIGNTAMSMPSIT